MLICEIKAANELADPDVEAKTSAATKWSRSASEEQWRQALGLRLDPRRTIRWTLRLLTITEDGSKAKDAAMEQQLHNPHPGEILKEEFLTEIGMSQNHLAQAIGVPENRIHAIVNGTCDICADTDLRLWKFFGLSEGYFLRLQNAYDTLEAKRRIAEEIAKIKPYKAA